jgi:FAD/FMN-containing dehydrogenase
MTATALSSGVSTALRRAGLTEVDDSRRRRAEYSSDASIYRVAPTVVAFPRHVEEILAALDVARTMSVPLTMRGAGTSIAGNAIGSGIVLDTSRHLGRVLQIDPARRVATVEPGCVMATLQREAAVHGLRFGPDPSSWTRATLGGMIGNNACGPHALAFGKTAQNVETLDWVDGTGRRFTAGYGDWGYDSVPGLHELVTSRLGVIRTELGTFARQVSGYSLEHLLPENGSHLARALVGSEGTLGIVLGAELNLVQVPAAPTLVVLGYPTWPPPQTRCPPCCGTVRWRSRGSIPGWSIWCGRTAAPPGFPTCRPARGG